MTTRTLSNRLTTLGAAISIAILAGACSGVTERTAETKSGVYDTAVTTSATGLIFSKKATGRHAEAGEVLKLFEALLEFST